MKKGGVHTCRRESFSRDLATEVRQTEWWSDAFESSEVAIHHRWLTWSCGVGRNAMATKRLNGTHRNERLHDKPAAISLRGDERTWQGQGRLDTAHLRQSNW